jgi:hypothetical protein
MLLGMIYRYESSSGVRNGAADFRRASTRYRDSFAARSGWSPGGEKVQDLRVHALRREYITQACTTAGGIARQEMTTAFVGSVILLSGNSHPQRHIKDAASL